MVKGLNLKYSVMLIPATLFFYITAILNPVILLKCVGDNCREKMRSEFDDDFGDYANYSDWRNGNASLQSDGNVTLMKFNHGYVKCNSDCDSCGWKDDDDDWCNDYNDTEYEELLADLANLSATVDDYNYTLPFYLDPDCSCREWCSGCDESDLVSLPGDDGLHRHTQDWWLELHKHCEKWEAEFGSEENEMCELFHSFTLTMKLTIIAFALLAAVLALMMFMEYTNFHIFYNGKCKVCFISPNAKKALFSILLIAPVSFMVYIYMVLRFGDTEELLNKYFDLIGAEFEYDWNTQGFRMFWISIALGCLSIVVMLFAREHQRHMRTIIGYKRGIPYEGGVWQPHPSGIDKGERDYWKPHQS